MASVALDFILCASLQLFIFVPKERFRQSRGSMRDSVLAMMISSNNRRLRRKHDGNRSTVLLGLSHTDSEPICAELKSSEIAFDVEVLQHCNDVVRHAQEKRPDVVVLDQDLFGRNGMDVAEEIRTGMGAWGEQVVLVVIASSDVAAAQQEKEQILAETLCLEDYIHGPFSPLYLRTVIERSVLSVPLHWSRALFSVRESRRLAALRRTELLDSDPEERFDRITRLCSATFGVPMALVSLVDSDRQFFKANVGLPGVCQTHRDGAFCAHSILIDDVMIVPNALHDSRFASNPLVEGDPCIRFYAGCPIEVTSADGGKYKIGTLCIIDTKPREFSEDNVRLLKDLGKMVEREIEWGMLHNKKVGMYEHRRKSDLV